MWIDAKQLFGPEIGDESAVLIIVFHPSSVLVTMRAKEIFTFFSRKILPDNHFGRLLEFGGLLQDPGYALLEFLVKIKNASW